MRGWPRVAVQVLGYRTELSRSSRRIDVHLRYVQDGRVVETWSRSPTGGGYGRGDIQAERQVAGRFPRGSTQQAYIDPAAPASIYLELPEPHIVAWLFCGGLLLVAVAAAVITPQLFGVPQELVTPVFMLVLAALLTVMSGFAAVALWKERAWSRRRRRPTRRGTRGPA